MCRGKISVPYVRNVVDKKVIIFVGNSIDGLLKFWEANNIASVIAYSHIEVIFSFFLIIFLRTVGRVAQSV